VKSERGSTLPLQIGLAVLLLSTIFVVADLQSLLMARERALSEARFASLYIAKQSVGVAPVVGLDYSAAVIDELPSVHNVHVSTSDGVTFEARVCEEWNSPFGLHASHEVCDEAKARVIG
jgi:hypothetical protein